MKPRHLYQAILVAIALTFLSFLLELISGGAFNYTTYLWNLLASVLVESVIGYYVIRSRYHSYKLWFATFAIFYVIGNFNILIEAFIFNVTDRTQTTNFLLMGIPYALVGSFMMIGIFGQLKKEATSLRTFLPRKALHWTGKILAANFLYIFFYVGAGILLQTFTPGFDVFYRDKIPPLADILITNMFFRGFVFVGIAILIDRSVTGMVLTKALLVGLIFSIVGGIAPLIPPNEYMPDFIRVAHGFEVGISNFLYGICVLLIVRSREEQEVNLDLPIKEA